MTCSIPKANHVTDVTEFDEELYLKGSLWISISKTISLKNIFRV